jgi:hypothetical protein
VQTSVLIQRTRRLPKARGLFVWALWVSLGAALAGCIVVPAGRRGGGPDGPYSSGGGGGPGGYGYGTPAPGWSGEAVVVAPPAPVYEVIPAAPGLGYIWIGGHWRWQLNRHIWIGGQWALPPRGYSVWVPHRWERGQRGWVEHPGRWRR